MEKLNMDTIKQLIKEGKINMNCFMGKEIKIKHLWLN